MKRYRISDIVWDYERDTDDTDELPAVALMDSDRPMQELVDGGASDWLSDRFGFAVKSCTVSEAHPNDRVYAVMVRRVEVYNMPVAVVATSREEAQKIVEKADDDDRFLEEWNDLFPSVKTTYTAGDGKDAMSLCDMAHKEVL